MSTHSVLSLWLLLKVLVPKDLSKYKVKLIFMQMIINTHYSEKRQTCIKIQQGYKKINIYFFWQKVHNIYTDIMCLS